MFNIEDRELVRIAVHSLAAIFVAGVIFFGLALLGTALVLAVEALVQ